MSLGSPLSRAALALVVLLAIPIAACSSTSTTTSTPDAGDAGDDANLPVPLPWSPGTRHLPEDDVLRVHHVQSLGTHNSYHVESPGNTVPDFHYSLAPLDVQLGQQGLRQLELDVHLIALDADFQVFHLGIDSGTTCKTLRECLTVIGTWSGAHRDHEPIYIQIEPKTGFAPEIADAYFAKIEAEILSVLVRERIVTPDEVRGSGATLGATVAKEGWPTLGRTRGRIIFTFDESGPLRDAYSRGRTSLAGRLLFVDSSPGDPVAAVAILNDPVANAAAIKAALAANMIVRTMADDPATDDAAAQAGLQASLAVGATWISTNFPALVAGRTTFASIPGGTPSRCNPVTAPASCAAADIESLAP